MGDRTPHPIVELAREFLRRGFERRVDREVTLALRCADVADELLDVRLRGGDGGRRGFVAWRGANGLVEYGGESVVEDLGFERDGPVSLTEEPLGNVKAPFRELLAELGVEGGADDVVPVFLYAPDDRNAVPPGPRQLAILEACLRGLLAADDAGRLDEILATGDDGSVARITVTTKGGVTSTLVDRLRWPDAFLDDPDHDPDAPEEDEPRGVRFEEVTRELPLAPERWFVVWVSTPGAIPSVSTMGQLVVIDEDSGAIVNHELLLGASETSVQTVLEDAMWADVWNGPDEPPRLRQMRPRAMVLTDEGTRDLLAPGLAELGVEAVVEPLPDALAATLRPFEEIVRCVDSEGVDVRDPRTFHDWRRILDMVVESIITSDAFDATDADRERFFPAGYQEGTDPLLEMAFLEAYVTGHRHASDGRTLVERALDEGTGSANVRAALEAHRDSVLSFYRCDARYPDGSLDVVDVLTGDEVRVRDPILAASDVVGRVVPLRVARVAGVAHPLGDGPTIDAVEAPNVLRMLEDEVGLEVTHEGLRRDRLLLGVLYDWDARGLLDPPPEEDPSDDDDGDEGDDDDGSVFPADVDELERGNRAVYDAVASELAAALEELPASKQVVLDGRRTVRELVEDDAMRPKVARLVRCLRSIPTTPGVVHPDRAGVLRALGLER